MNASLAEADDARDFCSSGHAEACLIQAASAEIRELIAAESQKGLGLPP